MCVFLTWLVRQTSANIPASTWVSVTSTTRLMAVKFIKFTCLWYLVAESLLGSLMGPGAGAMPTFRRLMVDGLRSPSPLAADFFLEISITSENRNKDNSYPLPHNSSEPPNSTTSILDRNTLCEDTKSGGQFSMSLKISKIWTCPSVFRLSSLMWLTTFLILVMALSKLPISLWSLFSL